MNEWLRIMVLVLLFAVFSGCNQTTAVPQLKIYEVTYSNGRIDTVHAHSCMEKHEQWLFKKYVKSHLPCNQAVLYRSSIFTTEIVEVK